MSAWAGHSEEVALKLSDRAQLGQEVGRPPSKELVCWRTEGRRAAGAYSERMQGWTFQGAF